MDEKENEIITEDAINDAKENTVEPEDRTLCIEWRIVHKD